MGPPPALSSEPCFIIKNLFVPTSDSVIDFFELLATFRRKRSDGEACALPS